MKEERVVQMFLPQRGIFGHSRHAGFMLSALLVAAPAGAVTADSVLADARGMAADTGDALAVFAHRILSGDMLAIQAAAFAASAFFGLIGLWLLLRGSREQALEDLIADTEMAAPDFIAGAPHHPAAPPMSVSEAEPDHPAVPPIVVAQESEPQHPAVPPIATHEPEPVRSTRLLEAIAAAKAQYDIALAERIERS